MKISSFLFIFTLTACSLGEPASPGEKSDSQAEDSVRSWTVDYALSGGFAGLSQHLSVTSNGTLIAADRKAGHQVEQTLSSEQLRELDALLTRLESAPATENPPAMAGRCADCIDYQLQITVDDMRYSDRFRSGEKMSPTYTDLASYISSLLRQALAKDGDQQ